MHSGAGWRSSPDAMQEIEVIGLRELLRLGDALGKGIPDMTASMAANASMIACDQRLTDAPVQTYLGVDGLA